MSDEPEGTISPEDLVQEPVSEENTEENSDESGKDVSDVAAEVIAGKWGTGQDRRKRLDDAGYNVSEVEEEVTKKLNK